MPHKIPLLTAKVLKLMWTEVWKVWFHQTAQSDSMQQMFIECKYLRGYHIFPSWPGRGEIPRFCSLGNWELLEVYKRFSVLSSKPSRPRAQEIEDNVQAMCKPWSWKSRLPCHYQTAVDLVAANMRLLFGLDPTSIILMAGVHNAPIDCRHDCGTGTKSCLDF